jgi:hypothetical protein
MSLKEEKIKKLELISESSEFFKEEVAKSIQKQGLKVAIEVQNYLVDLLSHFMWSENFFSTDERGKNVEPTLAFLLAQALEAQDESKKFEDLKKLGDVALYYAGFFSERFARKIIDVDYYIGMGTSAYSTLAQSIFDVHFKKVFSELSSGFVKFVDVIAEISAQNFASNPLNMLRTYELWLKTGSERAEKILKEAGLIPTKLKQNVQ